METDIELLKAARMMNKDALVKIFDLYSSPLFNYALRSCGDAILADQIVGDVFAELLDQLAVGTGPSVHLRSYLYEITYHQIVDKTRYSKHRVPLEAAEWLGRAMPSEFQNLENQMILRQLWKAIQNELSNDQRHVVILRFLEGFSLRETGAIIGKSEDQVKVIQSRAIAKLRQASQSNGNWLVAS